MKMWRVTERYWADRQAAIEAETATDAIAVAHLVSQQRDAERAARWRDTHE